MIRGVTLNGMHSKDDLGMYLTSFTIGLPGVQTNYVQVPGMDGMLDLTVGLTGEVQYNSRTIQMTFETCEKISAYNWSVFLSRISALFHGQEIEIVFDDDPEYYYTGRCEISDYNTDQRAKQSITMTCTCDPYKYNYSGAGIHWLWDGLSFETGLILIGEAYVDGYRQFVFENFQKRSSPTFVSDAALTVTYDGETYNIPAGTTELEDISFGPFETVRLEFSGEGNLKMLCDGGVL